MVIILEGGLYNGYSVLKEDQTMTIYFCIGSEEYQSALSTKGTCGHIEDMRGLRIQFCITTIPTGFRLGVD